MRRAPERPVLAVDIGTGSARALLFGPAGELLATHQRPLTLLHPRTGWSEQDPAEAVAAVADVIARAVAEAEPMGGVAAMSFSSQMYSVLAADRAGRPLTPSLPWTDARAVREADTLRSGEDGVELARVTGCPVQAAYPLAKIRWLKANGALPSGARFMAIKDYVLWQLTGRCVADRSTASASGLLDIRAGAWSDLALSVAGLGPTDLPDLASPHALITPAPGSRLVELGLGPDTLVVLGAGDAALSSVGSGAIAPDVLAINIGTSAAARRMVTEPVTDPAGRLWTYVVDEGHWVTGGSIGSAGVAYDWVVDLALGGSRPETHVRALELAGEAAPGADGVVFIPYVSGEQCPGWRPSSRGAFVGLGLQHERRHLIRAAIEGIAFALERVRRAIEVAGGPPIREVAVTGGVVRSPVVRRILADVLGLPVVEPAVHEGSARGAAVLAWLALGAIPDLETSGRRLLADAPRTAPSRQAHATYGPAYLEFVAIAETLGAQRMGGLP